MAERGRFRHLAFARRAVPWLPILAFVAAVIAVPSAFVFASSLEAAGGLPALSATVSDPLNRLALQNSFEQGALSAVLAGAVGYPAGVALGRFDFPGRRSIRSFLLIPFLLPTLVVLLGFQVLYGPDGWLSGPLPALGALGRGLAGVVGVNVYFDASVVALLTATAIEGSSRELEEAVAVLGGPPRRAYREVWGPPSWVGAGAGMLLTFLLSALAFAQPLVVCGARCYTVEVRVWALAETLGDPASAGVLALVAVALFTVPMVLYLWASRAFRGRGARRVRSARPLRRNDPASWAAAAYLTIFVAAIGLLLVAVAARAVAPPSVGGGSAAWSALVSGALSARLGFSTGAAVANTLFYATAAALLTVLLAVTTAYAVRASEGSSAWVEYVLFLPLLISPILLAFGLASFWRPELGEASSTWLLILLSQAAVALPFAVRSLRLALLRLGRGPWEAARVLGRAPFDAHLDVELPRLRAGLVGSVLFAFAIGLGEFTATYFLVLPQYTTVPVELLRLESLRLGGVADALAGLLLALCLLTFLAIEWGGRRIEL
ncbi:MAG TPA: hypothetical protein VGV89_05140 [Thermoplasmata archaeon]|nr:hypothetical protein [Thermoplasmata archaeon]